jgi:uncharacterized protein (DUF2236 family)
MTQQYAVLATALRVPAKMWPVDRKAFWECWGRMMETLTIMPPAIAVGNDLLYNQRLLIWARISMPVLRLLTTVLLPPCIRNLYSLKMSKTRYRTYRILIGVTRLVYPYLLLSVRSHPINYYLNDIHRCIRDIAQVIWSKALVSIVSWCKVYFREIRLEDKSYISYYKRFHSLSLGGKVVLNP